MNDVVLRKSDIWTRCLVCSKPICKVEKCLRDGHDAAAQLTTGEWVCSSLCWDYATDTEDEDLQQHIDDAKVKWKKKVVKKK